jgi:predicted nucleotidyltransferase
MPPESIRPLLDDLKAELEDLYGDRLARVVLYGSYARGEAHEESDVDVLVVLEGEVDAAREIRRMGDAAFEVGLRHGQYVSVFPVSADDYAAATSNWLQNVHRDEVAL